MKKIKWHRHTLNNMEQGSFKLDSDVTDSTVNILMQMFPTFREYAQLSRKTKNLVPMNGVLMDVLYDQEQKEMIRKLEGVTFFPSSTSLDSNEIKLQMFDASKK